MVSFSLNGRRINYTGDENRTLLSYLRETEGITFCERRLLGSRPPVAPVWWRSMGKPNLHAPRKLKFLGGAQVITMEGIPAQIRDVIAKAYVNRGAVQCGFCTPGMIMRTQVLFAENPDPNREKIKKAINLNLCRCTGYVKIVDAIEEALKTLREGE